MRDVAFPVAFLCPDFLTTVIFTVQDFSDNVGYCFENHDSDDWRVFDTYGNELYLHSIEQQKANLWPRLIKGRLTQYEFDVDYLEQCTKEILGSAILDLLSAKPNWWWNNEAKVDIFKVRNVINESNSVKEMFENLGSFSDEVF